MNARRATAAPAVLLLAAALVAGCGGTKDDHTSAGRSTTPPSTSAPARTTASPGGTTPVPDDAGTAGAPPFPANTEPDTGEPSAGAALTVTDIRIGLHDRFDRVVFQLAGAGTPGWDARYVDKAVGQARGDVVPVKGNAIVQVTIRGVGYPADTGVTEYAGSRLLPGHGTGVVTEVVWNGTFEGTSVAFVGTAERAPFRVYRLDAPARVVLDVVHHDG